MIKSLVKYGDIDLRSAHFLITAGEDWMPIAILSAPTDKVVDMKLALLVHDPDMGEVFAAMHKELNLYLYELSNPCRISYLIYHSTTMSNVYSRIHFTYIDKIDGSNLLHYVLTNSKLLGFHNTIAVSTLHQQLTNIMIDGLFAEALGGWGQFDDDQYNRNLAYLHNVLFIELPKIHDYQLQDMPGMPVFADSIAKLSSMDFCNVIHYLKKIKLIKRKEIQRFLEFYRINQKMQ